MSKSMSMKMETMAGVCVDKDYSSKNTSTMHKGNLLVKAKKMALSVSLHMQVWIGNSPSDLTSGNNDMCLTSWEKYALETTGFVSLPTKSMTWKLLPIMF